MKKYYSALNKNFYQHMGLIAIVVMMLLPGVTLSNGILLYNNAQITFLTFVSADLVLIWFMIRTARYFSYTLYDNGVKIDITVAKEVNPIYLKDIKKIETTEKNSLNNLGFGNKKIKIIFNNDEYLHISPKKKEFNEVYEKINEQLTN